MDVKSPQPRQIDDFLRQQVSVSDDDGYIGLELMQALVKIRVARVTRLKEGDFFLDGDLLHRRWNYLSRSSLRFVGIGDDANDLESFTDERAQCRRGKFRRTPENYPHYISVSWW